MGMHGRCICNHAAYMQYSTMAWSCEAGEIQSTEIEFGVSYPNLPARLWSIYMDTALGLLYILAAKFFLINVSHGIHSHSMECRSSA